MSAPRPEDDLNSIAPAGSAIPATLVSLVGRAPDLEGVSEALTPLAHHVRRAEAALSNEDCGSALPIAGGGTADSRTRAISAR